MKYIISILFFSVVHAYGQATVIASGNWSLTRGSSNITDAGLDFANVATSGAAGETTLNLNGMEKNKTWKVYIRRIDSNWHPSLVLTAIKQSDGTVSAANSGVTIAVSPAANAAIQTIATSSTTPFFTAIPSNSCNSCSLLNMKIRYEISGISVTIPVGTYETQVEYTITDL